MARIFLSYRRADGLFPVGWIAERLEQIDSVDGVQAAFHDDQLRTGDDFPDALEREIEGCDVVLALIGEHWLGETATGRSRIQDADDWVVRELTIALRLDKRVLPVLIDGQDHPLASQLHPGIQEIARLHAVPFADSKDLDQIERHVRSHLDELDRERARLAGLDEPVENPSFPRRSAVIAMAVVTAGVWAGLSAWVTWFTLPSSTKDTDAVLGTMMSYVVMMATVAAAASVSIALDRWVDRVAEFDLARVVLVAGFMWVVLPLIALNFLDIEGLRTPVYVTYPVFAAFATVAAVPALAEAVSTRRAADHDLAGRVRYVRVIERASFWGIVMLSVLLATAMPTSIWMSMVGDELGRTDLDPVKSVSLAVVSSGILLGIYLWVTARSRPDVENLEEVLATLPVEYRNNAAVGAADVRRHPVVVGVVVMLPVIVVVPCTLWANLS
jgi:hypothetical protein